MNHIHIEEYSGKLEYDADVTIGKILLDMYSRGDDGGESELHIKHTSAAEGGNKEGRLTTYELLLSVNPHIRYRLVVIVYHDQDRIKASGEMDLVEMFGAKLNQGI